MNISIGKCGSISINLKFESGEDLNKFEESSKEFFQDLKKTFIESVQTYMNQPNLVRESRDINVGLIKEKGPRVITPKVASHSLTTMRVLAHVNSRQKNAVNYGHGSRLWFDHFQYRPGCEKSQVFH